MSPWLCIQKIEKPDNKNPKSCFVGLLPFSGDSGFGVWIRIHTDVLGDRARRNIIRRAGGGFGNSPLFYPAGGFVDAIKRNFIENRRVYNRLWRGDRCGTAVRDGNDRLGRPENNRRPSFRMRTNGTPPCGFRRASFETLHKSHQRRRPIAAENRARNCVYIDRGTNLY